MLDRRWLPLNALRAFEAVGRHLSFTAAAQALSVSQSAVSRHVISLEALLGQSLFDRRPQGLALTDAGAILLPAVRKSFDRIEQSLNTILRERSASRTLRVQMPPSFAHHLAVPILRDFRAETPDIRLDITSGALREDADVALVYARPQVGLQVADLLWMVRLTPMCSPALADRLAGLGLAEFLRQAELLHVRLEGETRHVLWEMFVRRCGLDVAFDRGLSFDTASLAAQYALAGEGVALLDAHMFAGDVVAGRLAAPFAETLDDGYGYYLTIEAEDLADPAIARFRAWMIGRFGSGQAGAGAPLQ